MKYIPQSYQTPATNFVVKTPRCAIHIDMGLGKTVAVLTAIKQLYETYAIRGVIVFAPIRVATLTWPDEIAKWDHLKGLDFCVLRGTKTERLKMLAERHFIYLTNYELMDWVNDYMRDNRDNLPWDTCVLDESSKMKSASSQRFKTIRNALVSPLFDRVIEMTGTPMPEKYEDLWSQFYLLDAGERLSPYVTHFRAKYFIQSQFSLYDRKLRPGADREIQKKIADITMALRAKDWLNLPDVIENNVLINLPERAQAIYDKMEKEMVVAINEKEIMAGSAAIVSEKCRQIASGGLYHEDGTTEMIHTAKMDELAEIVEDTDEPILAAFWYRHEAVEIKRRFKNAPILGPGMKDADASRIVKEWNAKKHKLLFMHPASVGHGINLQHGGRILVWITIPWSNEMYAQTVARLQRMGQTKPVLVHRLIAKGTVDELVVKAVKTKEASQAALLKALVESRGLGRRKVK